MPYFSGVCHGGPDDGLSSAQTKRVFEVQGQDVDGAVKLLGRYEHDGVKWVWIPEEEKKDDAPSDSV